MNLAQTIVSLYFLFTFCESAKILYIMPFSARSHYIGMKNLAVNLAKRGHEVYVITPYKEEIHPPTYYQLMIRNTSVWNTLFDEPPNIFSMLDLPFTEFQMLLYRSSFMVNDYVFNSIDVQNFLKNNHKIDLVISELFFNEALYMLAHKYQSPLVLVTTFGNSLKGNYFSRNPLQLSTLYHEYGRTAEPLSFIGRLYNLYICAYDIIMTKYWYMAKQEEYVKQYLKDLPEPVPTVEEMASKPSLILMNSHYSVDTPAAYLPNFIEVGGLHLTESNTSLPEDLQIILDTARNSVVFLSLGSNVRTCEMTKEKLKAFLTVFGELKQTVLMKWENTSMPIVPKNVILRTWFPQREILRHPNVKLFIGHGGLLGMQETITAGVPILGIPVFGDQYLNILNAHENGHGELMEYKDITEEKLRTVINKLLNDKSYSIKAKEVALRFQDRPMSPIQTAIWWIEYVIRHKGAEFMKTPTLKMNFVAYNNIDVYLFMAVVLYLSVHFIWKVIIYAKSPIFKVKPTKKQKKL